MTNDNSNKSITHICLLDENPISVLTPLLDPDIQSNRVIFAIKPNQEEAILRLKKVVKPRGVKVSTWILPTTTNTGDILLSFHKLISTELKVNPSEQLVLNTTCGSRHYVLAAFEVAKDYGLHCFIVEPKFDELYWLYPEERENSALAEKLKISDYLTALDSEVKEVANNGVVSLNKRTLGAKWCSEPDYYSSALGILNYLAYTADNNFLTSVKLTKQQLENAALSELIDDLMTISYAQFDNDKLVFKNDSARFFANGGWLEEYVYGTILSLKKDIPTLQDVAQGVEVVRNVGKHTVNNELDVAALANNKLHIIECKTKNFDKGEGNNVIYKLDSLADLLGGLHGRAMLVSFKEIRVAEQYRALELDIKFIGPHELPNLSEHLTHWLKTA
ncbi:MAG: hypothetical protein ACI9EK_001234 [Psychroserpens sp.]|jgi:hypothetical protein